MEINKDVEKEFEFAQKKLWQLPENTLLERQTLEFIREFGQKCYEMGLAAK